MPCFVPIDTRPIIPHCRARTSHPRAQSPIVTPKDLTAIWFRNVNRKEVVDQAVQGKVDLAANVDQGKVNAVRGRGKPVKDEVANKVHAVRVVNVAKIKVNQDKVDLAKSSEVNVRGKTTAELRKDSPR
jgi:hypothetical protein